MCLCLLCKEVDLILENRDWQRLQNKRRRILQKPHPLLIKTPVSTYERMAKRNDHAALEARQTQIHCIDDLRHVLSIIYCECQLNSRSIKVPTTASRPVRVPIGRFRTVLAVSATTPHAISPSQLDWLVTHSSPHPALADGKTRCVPHTHASFTRDQGGRDGSRSTATQSPPRRAGRWRSG